MTNIKIDLDEIIKEAILDNFDMDSFVNALDRDIHESNPEWWAEKIVEPLRGTLNKAILENKDFIKAVIWEYMDREFYGEVKKKLNCIIYEYVGTKVEKAMPEFNIIFKEKTMRKTEE